MNRGVYSKRTDRLQTLRAWLEAVERVTADELAAIACVTPRTIYRDVVELRARGLRVVGEPNHGYSLRKLRQNTKQKRKPKVASNKIRQIKLNALMYAICLEELLEGPCTAQHLSAVSGMGLVTTQRMLRAMSDRKLLHIAGWERDAAGRVSVRVFGFGAGKDAKKPTMTRREMNVRCRAMRRQKDLAAAGNPFAGLSA